MTFELALITILPATLIAAGLGVEWYLSSRRKVRSGPDAPSGSSWLAAGRIIGGALILAGILIAGTVMTHVFAVFFWIITLLIALAAVRRFQAAEQKSLLWLLSAAAARDIPLHEAARAFAAERTDRVGERAARLADYLEAGVPLGLSLQRADVRISTTVRLAADLGQHTGTLGKALRQSGENDVLEATIKHLTQWLFYFGFLVASIAIAMTFTLIELTPKLAHIFRDFNAQLPAPTRYLMDIGAWIADYWFAFVPLVAIGAFLFVAASLHFVGISVHDIPVLRRLWWRADSALVMRWLAVAVQQHRSVPEMVRLLAGYYPQPGIRRRLVQAGRWIDQGRDWTESLSKVGLIRQAELHVFQAAQRAGNLAWALEQMSETTLRQFAYRFRAALDVLLPLALLALGAVVLAIALAVLLPLFSLIQRTL